MRSPPAGHACTGLALMLFIPLLAPAHGTDCETCEAAPVSASVVYTADMWRNVSGGVATGNRYLDNIDLTVEIDGARLLGIDGLTFFGYALYNNGHALAEELVGSAQGVSNIETTQALRLYELWTQWQFGEHGASLRFGLYDLNSEFDAIDSAALFIGPSHGIGPDFSQSGRNGPSIFPATSLAVRAAARTGPWGLRAAILDGVPGDPEHPDRTRVRLTEEDGLLIVGEADYVGESGFRIGAGHWRYTADFDDLTALDAGGAALQRDDNAGFYVIAESPVLFSEDNAGGLRLFARIGRAQARINAIERYCGGGAVHTGVLTGDDQLGIAVAVAKLGNPYRLAQQAAAVSTTATETQWELTYRLPIGPWLTLQPDIQYVRNPGMNPGLEAAWVAGLRFEIGLF